MPLADLRCGIFPSKYKKKNINESDMREAASDAHVGLVVREK